MGAGVMANTGFVGEEQGGHGKNLVYFAERILTIEFS